MNEYQLWNESIELESGMFKGVPYQVYNWINQGVLTLHIQPTFKNKEISIKMINISHLERTLIANIKL